MRQNRTFLCAILFGFFTAATLMPLAAAQTYGGPNSGLTVEQALEKARERVEIVKQHSGEGSGTPYLNANGVIGATLISGAVFGSIFVAFIVRAKQVERKLSRSTQ